MSAAEKAIPVPTEENRPYWEGARERKLVLQACTKCGIFSSQPRVICPKCHNDQFEWKQASGKGKIHSYTIVWQTTARGFTDEIPYIVCHAEIDEEPTCYITANLLGVEQANFEKLTINLPVVMDYEDRGEAIVPQWRLANPL